MIHDLFLISSTTLLLAGFICSLLLFIWGRNSKPKSILWMTFLFLTVYIFAFSVFFYCNFDYRQEIIEFPSCLVAIVLVNLMYIYFRRLMCPQKGDSHIFKIVCLWVGVYVVFYLLFSITGLNDVYLYEFSDIKTNIFHPIVLLRLGVFLHFLIQFIVAHIDVYDMYIHHKKYIESRYSFGENIDLAWIPYLLGVFVVCGITSIFDMFVSGEIGYLYIILNFIYAIFFLLTGILGFNQQDVYSEWDILDLETDENEESSHPTMSIHLRLLLKEQLHTLMAEKKMYRDSDLCIDAVAEELMTNKVNILIVISDDFDDNFMGFVNRYRIEEAKLQLDTTDDELSIAQIASKVGFKSTSSFNTFFKRYTFCNPSDYKKPLSDEKQ